MTKKGLNSKRTFTDGKQMKIHVGSKLKNK